ncbi:MAG: hypothetical protein C4297_03340 [Gemmataceae bacterium]
MSTNLEILRALHLKHLQVRRLREQAEELPRLLRRHQARVALQQKQLEELQDLIKHLKVTIHEKEVSLKTAQQKKNRYQQQLDSATSKKEYDALRVEIENEQQVIRVLEDEILEAMVDLEERQKQLPEIQRQLDEARRELQAAEAEHAARHRELVQLLQAAEHELRQAESELLANQDLRAMYARLVQAYGADALAPVTGRSCSGCYTELTPQDYNNLLVGRLVACKNCGRLLYLELS